MLASAFSSQGNAELRRESAVAGEENPVSGMGNAVAGEETSVSGLGDGVSGEESLRSELGAAGTVPEPGLEHGGEGRIEGANGEQIKETLVVGKFHDQPVRGWRQLVRRNELKDLGMAWVELAAASEASRSARLERSRGHT